jgi:hypothetical protein
MSRPEQTLDRLISDALAKGWTGETGLRLLIKRFVIERENLTREACAYLCREVHCERGARAILETLES